MVKDTPSAPSSSHIFAKDTISSALGESFTTNLCRHICRIWRTMSLATSVLVPKFIPPLFTFGQEMFSSRISRSTSFNFSIPRRYPSTECPPRLTILTTSFLLIQSRSFSIKASTPGFSRPTLFIIPLAVSQIRIPSLPPWGCSSRPLEHKPPNFSISKYSFNSRPKPQVPEAKTTGFLKGIPANNVFNLSLISKYLLS